MLVLDTHVLLWLAADDAKLGSRAGKRIDRAARGEGVGVSAFSYWEVETLIQHKRVRGIRGADELRAEAVQLGIAALEVDADIAILAARLRGFHGDPADRIIVATAQVKNATLVTADEVLLEWGHGLRTADAAR